MIFQRGDGYVNSNGEPVNQDGTPIGEVQDTAAQLASVTEQRDSLQAQVNAGTTEAQGQIDALTSERDTLKGTLESITAERDQAHERIAQLSTQAQSQDTALAERVAEVDTLKARISELESTPVPVAEPGLPADALERLVAVKGIGESLAKQALDALTAK